MKNKKLIVGLLACLLAVSVPFIARQPNKVKAQTFTSNYPYIATPTVVVNVSSVSYTILPYFISYNTDRAQFSLLWVGSGDGLAYDYRLSHFTNNSIIDMGRSPCLTYYESSQSRQVFSILANNTVGQTVKFKVSSSSSFDVILNLVTNCSVSIDSNRNINYYFRDNNNNTLLTFTISNSRFINVYNKSYGSVQILSTNDTEYLLANASDYFDLGYEYGYSIGYNTGLSSSTPLMPFDYITSSVNSLLNLDLFPGVKISYLIYLGFGFAVLSIVLKVVN